jgi:hypothetical protein
MSYISLSISVHHIFSISRYHPEISRVSLNHISSSQHLYTILYIYQSIVHLTINICTPYIFISRYPPEISRVSVPQYLDIIPRYLEISLYTRSRVSLNTVQYINYTICVSHLYRPSPSLIPLYSKHLSPLYT